MAPAQKPSSSLGAALAHVGCRAIAVSGRQERPHADKRLSNNLLCFDTRVTNDSAAPRSFQTGSRSRSGGMLPPSTGHHDRERSSDPTPVLQQELAPPARSFSALGAFHLLHLVACWLPRSSPQGPSRAAQAWERPASPVAAGSSIPVPALQEDVRRVFPSRWHRHSSSEPFNGKTQLKDPERPDGSQEPESGREGWSRDSPTPPGAEQSHGEQPGVPGCHSPAGGLRDARLIGYRERGTARNRGRCGGTGCAGSSRRAGVTYSSTRCAQLEHPQVKRTGGGGGAPARAQGAPRPRHPSAWGCGVRATQIPELALESPEQGQEAPKEPVTTSVGWPHEVGGELCKPRALPPPGSLQQLWGHSWSPGSQTPWFTRKEEPTEAPGARQRRQPLAFAPSLQP